MLFPQRQAIGRVVLAAYGIGFAGVLLIGQKPMLLSILAFVATVLWRLANAPRRRTRLTRIGRVGWAPFPGGPWLFLAVPALIGAVYLPASAPSSPGSCSSRSRIPSEREPLALA